MFSTIFGLTLAGLKLRIEHIQLIPYLRHQFLQGVRLFLQLPCQFGFLRFELLDSSLERLDSSFARVARLGGLVGNDQACGNIGKYCYRLSLIIRWENKSTGLVKTLIRKWDKVSYCIFSQEAQPSRTQPSTYRPPKGFPSLITCCLWCRWSREKEDDCRRKWSWTEEGPPPSEWSPTRQRRSWMCLKESLKVNACAEMSTWEKYVFSLFSKYICNLKLILKPLSKYLVNESAKSDGRRITRWRRNIGVVGSWTLP